MVALFVTRVLLRSEKFVNRFRWFFDIEKAPFRSRWLLFWRSLRRLLSFSYLPKLPG